MHEPHAPASGGGTDGNTNGSDEPSLDDLAGLAGDALAALGHASALAIEETEDDPTDEFAAWLREVRRQGAIPSKTEALRLPPDELARRNLPYAVAILMRLAPFGCSTDLRMRLVSAANAGLVEAAARYNPAHRKGASFVTYAYWWIRKYVVKELAESATQPLPLSEDTFAAYPTLVAPALVLPPPRYSLHEISRDTRAVLVLLAHDVDLEMAGLLVLRSGALVPGLRYFGWHSPADWIPGRPWSHRRIAAHVGHGLGYVQRRLARIEDLLAVAARASPEATRLRSHLCSLGKPSVRHRAPSIAPVRTPSHGQPHARDGFTPRSVGGT